MRQAKSNCTLLKVSPSFPYIRTLMAGRRVNQKHPQMDRVHRAKIFAPFDALDGYSDLINTKSRSYDEELPVKTEENICMVWDDP